MSAAGGLPCFSLRRAYRLTTYIARDGRRDIAVRIDEPSAALQEAMARHHATACAFVTAWNPASRIMPDRWNRAAGDRLARELARSGCATLPYAARADAGNWPAEEGLLAFGLGRFSALALARRFDQNAIVWCGIEARPRLLFCRAQPAHLPANIL